MASKRDRRLEYSSVVRPVLLYLEKIPNCKAINVHGGIYTESGTPDIIGVVDGKPFVFECKRDSSEEPEEIQEWRMKEWSKAGAFAACVHDKKEAQAIIEELRKRPTE